MKSLKTVLKTLLVLLLLVIGWAWSGMYDIAADRPHTRPVSALLEVLRERSADVRASDIEVPPLDDEAQIRAGAGNYDAMCSGCHLSPGMAETELSRGLYPAPPNLARTGIDNPAEAFWTIKHGIKASGMPAWGKSMEDRHIWDMVALASRLPELTAEQYHALVEASGGHSHGGAETPAHEHGPGETHDREAEPDREESAPSPGDEHRHEHDEDHHAGEAAQAHQH